MSKESNMRTGDFMTAEVVTANLADGLHQTFQRMCERGIRHMPVLGDGGQLEGLISDRDLRRPDFVDDGPNKVGYYCLDNTVQVRAAMSTPPVTVGVDEDIREALELFLEHKFGALPVVDTNGALVGILSAHDVLHAFKRQAAPT